jgi:UDP-arabinose 4-epimerase
MLAAAGHEPVVYDNLRTGHRWAAKWGPFVHGDVLDTDRVAEAIDRHEVEAVMHFAALAYVGESVVEPNMYYQSNVGGLVSVLKAMNARGVKRAVFSSTCAVYGTPPTTPISEEMPCQPINPYGRSKLMCEHILRDHAVAYGIGAVALRYFNAAGADADGEIGEDHEPETHLIPLVLEAAAGLRDSITIFGEDYDTPDGTCIRDYIHVSDLADAHVRALHKCEPGVFDAINLGTGAGFSVNEIIEAVRSVTTRDFRVVSAPRRPGDPPSLIADPAKAEAKLGWRASHSDLKNIIETAWTWLGKQTKVAEKL